MAILIAIRSGVPRYRFSKVSLLLNLVYQVTAELTFAKIYQLGLGEWSSFGNGKCASDSEMCVLKNCNIRDNELSSMYIPEGVKVTLYTGKYFSGR